MTTYSEVVQQHYSHTRYMHSGVAYTNAVGGLLHMNQQTLDGELAAIVCAVREPHAATGLAGVLSASVEASKLGLVGLERVALSQLNPFHVSKRSKLECAAQAYRLSVSRTLAEAVLGHELAIPKAIHDALPQSSQAPRLSHNLLSLKTKLGGLEAGNPEVSGAAARAIVERAGYDEQFIADIALSELEPDTALTQLSTGDWGRFYRDCGILMSARNISRYVSNIESAHTIDRIA